MNILFLPELIHMPKTKTVTTGKQYADTAPDVAYIEQIRSQMVALIAKLPHLKGKLINRSLHVVLSL